MGSRYGPVTCGTTQESSLSPILFLLYVAELLLQGPEDDRGDARHSTGRGPRTCGVQRRPYNSPDHHSRESRLSASVYGDLVSTSTGRCV
ncbi:hypothetical protein N7522_006357 [Penicillium canescens]|nr:hypothetical protein N7522_006357 [Penicillium canescens]